MQIVGVLLSLALTIVAAQPKCADNATVTHIKELEAQAANLTSQLNTLDQEPSENRTWITRINETRAEIEKVNATILQTKDQRQDVLEAMARSSYLKDANFTLFSMRNVNKQLKALQNLTEAVQRQLMALNSSSATLRNDYNSLDNRTRTLRTMVGNYTDTIRNSSQGIEQDRTWRSSLENKLKVLADNVALACARLRNYITDLPPACRGGNFSGNATSNTTNATVPARPEIPPPATSPNVTMGRNQTTPVIVLPNATREPNRGRRDVVVVENCIDRENATARENSLINKVANLTDTITRIRTGRQANQTLLESQFEELNSTLNRLEAERALAQSSLMEARMANETRRNISTDDLLVYLPLAQELQLKGLSQNATANMTNYNAQLRENLEDWHDRWLMLEHNVSAMNATLADRTAQLDSLKEELSMMNETLRNSNGTIATLQRELETKKKEADDLRQQYNMSQQRVKYLNESVTNTQLIYDDVQRKMREVIPHFSAATTTGISSLVLCVVAALSFLRV